MIPAQCRVPVIFPSRPRRSRSARNYWRRSHCSADWARDFHHYGTIIILDSSVALEGTCFSSDGGCWPDRLGSYTAKGRVLSSHFVCYLNRLIDFRSKQTILTCRWTDSLGWKVINNNNSSNTTKINYLNWRFDLNQKKLVLSSSGSWHDWTMPCQESGRRRDWVDSCPRPDS